MHARFCSVGAYKTGDFSKALTQQDEAVKENRNAKLKRVIKTKHKPNCM